MGGTEFSLNYVDVFLIPEGCFSLVYIWHFSAVREPFQNIENRWTQKCLSCAHFISNEQAPMSPRGDITLMRLLGRG